MKAIAITIVGVVVLLVAVVGCHSVTTAINNQTKALIQFDKATQHNLCSQQAYASGTTCANR